MLKKIIKVLKNRFFIKKEELPYVLKKMIKISFLLIILKIIINNFYMPKEFYWDKFDFKFKKREYFLEWEDGCKIIEIGKKGRYYYGRVISGGITFYKVGNSDFDYLDCENEYFLIDSHRGLDIYIYYKNKEDILKVIKKYKAKEPYKFFIFSIWR